MEQATNKTLIRTCCNARPDPDSLRFSTVLPPTSTLAWVTTLRALGAEVELEAGVAARAGLIPERARLAPAIIAADISVRETLGMEDILRILIKSDR